MSKATEDAGRLDSPLSDQLGPLRELAAEVPRFTVQARQNTRFPLDSWPCWMR